MNPPSNASPAILPAVAPEEWCRFFRAWSDVQVRDPLTASLGAFFAGWAGLTRSREPRADAVGAAAPEMRRFFEAFEPPATRLRHSGAYLNVWRLLRVGRDEVDHCRILRWILDAHSDHPHGREVLQDILTRALGRCHVAFDVARILRSDYRVHTETLPTGAQDSRVDLEVDGDDFLVLIEAKIDAPEGHRQLHRYLEAVESKAAGRQSLLVFLTLDGREPGDPDLRGRVATLSWNEIARTLDQRATTTPESFQNQLLRQFADHLRSL